MILEQTKILKVTKNADTKEDLQNLLFAADIIKKGGLVVFPTETVYGLGANALDENACKKIFEAKGRPQNNPLIMHLDDKNKIGAYCETEGIYGLEQLKALMPAPLTVILPAKDIVPRTVTGGLDTVAVRVPTSDIARKLIEKRPFDDIPDFVSNLNDTIESFDKSNNNSKDTSNGRTPSRDGDTFVVSGSIDKEITTEDLNLNPSPVIQTTAFSDLGGYEWANEAIAYMKVQGIINGVGNDLFAPGTSVKREEFAKMIVLAFDIKADAQKVDFDDVQKNSWYAPYVAAASDKGIIKGMSNSLFGVGDNITREDMAVMCYRAIQSEGIEIATKRSKPNFSDSISDYAVDAVNELYRAEIINGTGEGRFGAKAGATRAEAAKLLYEILKNRSGAGE